MQRRALGVERVEPGHETHDLVQPRRIVVARVQRDLARPRRLRRHRASRSRLCAASVSKQAHAVADLLHE